MATDNTPEFRKLAEHLKQLYQDQGKSITDDEATEAGHNLIGFFKLLYEIDRENKKKK